MSFAFHGDAAIQAALLRRIDDHLTRGRLEFGVTRWDGEGGSALGVSIAGIDPADYVVLYGYPLALASFLDPLSAMIGGPGAASFVRAWVAGVTPGRDLSGVPAALVIELLDAPETRGLAPELTAPLLALHRREAAGERVARAEWSVLRAEILTALEAAPARRLRGLLELCEAACWPTGTSRSILSTMAAKWCDLDELAFDPDWSDDDRDRAQAELAALLRRRTEGGGGEPAIPKMFATQSPDLARRFEANLIRVNARRHARVVALAGIVLRRLSGAGRAGNRCK